MSATAPPKTQRLLTKERGCSVYHLHSVPASLVLAMLEHLGRIASGSQSSMLHKLLFVATFFTSSVLGYCAFTRNAVSDANFEEVAMGQTGHIMHLYRDGNGGLRLGRSLLAILVAI
jgi:hypothetical protein